MALAESLPLTPSASVAATGLGIRYMGDRCYAYSGATTITSGSYADGLNFTTGNGFILAKLQIWTADVTGADLFYQITLNGVVMVQQANNNPSGSGAAGMETPVILLLPPFSEVEVSGQRGSGSDYDVYFTLTGRVYGVA